MGGDKVFTTSYESAIHKAGFDVLVISNPGRRPRPRRASKRRGVTLADKRCSPHQPAPTQLGWRGLLAKAHNL